MINLAIRSYASGYWEVVNHCTTGQCDSLRPRRGNPGFHAPMKRQLRSIARAAGPVHDTWILVTMVLLGLIARLGLANFPSHGYDTFAYREWTWHLAHAPLAHFYDQPLEVPADHLPGDLWLLALLWRFSYAVYPAIDFYSANYSYLIALLATLFDIVLAIALWRAGTAIGRARTGLVVGIAWWCSPVSILVASIWGADRRDLCGNCDVCVGLSTVPPVQMRIPVAGVGGARQTAVCAAGTTAPGRPGVARRCSA